jgi:catechol 2,3-dioxygenase-like lactoylglutathione lyase family enzyme
VSGVTGFGNLAVQVSDIDVACAWWRRLGAAVDDPLRTADGGMRADVDLSGVRLTLFTRAIYAAELGPLDDGWLHAAWFVADLDAALAGHRVLWGPHEITGPFGRRRIAFVAAPGGIRVELMQQVEGR